METLTLSRFKGKAAFPVLGFTAGAWGAISCSPSSKTSDSKEGKSSATRQTRALHATSLFKSSHVLTTLLGLLLCNNDGSETNLTPPGAAAAAAEEHGDESMWGKEIQGDKSSSIEAAAGVVICRKPTASFSFLQNTHPQKTNKTWSSNVKSQNPTHQKKKGGSGGPRPLLAFQTHPKKTQQQEPGSKRVHFGARVHFASAHWKSG